MINVWGDSIGAGVVAHLSRKEVAELEREAEKDEKIELVSEEAVNKAYEKKDEDNGMNTTNF